MDNDKLAIMAIKKYLNKFELPDEDIQEKFGYAIELIKNNIDNAVKKDSNVSAITEGSRSVTFNNSDTNVLIDSKVKAVLPRPSLKMW